MAATLTLLDPLRADERTARAYEVEAFNEREPVRRKELFRRAREIRQDLRFEAATGQGRR